MKTRQQIKDSIKNTLDEMRYTFEREMTITKERNNEVIIGLIFRREYAIAADPSKKDLYQKNFEEEVAKLEKDLEDKEIRYRESNAKTLQDRVQNILYADIQEAIKSKKSWKQIESEIKAQFGKEKKSDKDEEEVKSNASTEWQEIVNKAEDKEEDYK